eukprot:3466432-Rhodomonas_salina.1
MDQWDNHHVITRRSLLPRLKAAPCNARYQRSPTIAFPGTGLQLGDVKPQTVSRNAKSWVFAKASLSELPISELLCVLAA